MNILVCFDGSDVSYDALSMATKRAGQLGAKLYIATSMMTDRDRKKEDFEKVEKRLNKAKLAVVKEDIACETILSTNKLTPGEDLVRIAEEIGIDEVYIGVQKQSRVGKLMFGSTAQYVILKAPCPVVTVK